MNASGLCNRQPQSVAHVDGCMHPVSAAACATACRSLLLKEEDVCIRTPQQHARHVTACLYWPISVICQSRHARSGHVEQTLTSPGTQGPGTVSIHSAEAELTQPSQRLPPRVRAERACDEPKGRTHRECWRAKRDNCRPAPKHGSVTSRTVGPMKDRGEQSGIISDPLRNIDDPNGILTAWDNKVRRDN